MSSARDALAARRSRSKVTDAAPSHEEILAAAAVAGRVADHSSLHPWRLIELRGEARARLGEAIARAEASDSPSTKPLRAPLLIAIVAARKPSTKVPHWEQDAVASGVAHMLSLLLDEAGWGVMWRTGHYTRSESVAAMHGLGDDERLLGWLYVGGRLDAKPGKGDGAPKLLDAERFVSVLD
ncbi:nitroreductase family protein [Humibacter ginsenosidimutans]|uniref:Putative NAD(P)H nitroreductase n=1 Tax=Humibacter ginsenosidimutans TaxID=2599293 RepID=A0A5B8M3M5_9MICO|nr:nitroreductase family protein [Humibacter ginsenosidimutans]QDZ14751.1 nitroreductase [Humibacter ginsenosidimutans]